MAAAAIASAQVSPQAGHTTVGAGAGLDGAVSPMGGFAASVPLDLPSPRGSVPIPLSVVYTGSNRAGVAGQGWDVPISFVRRTATIWRRKPFANQTSSWTEAPFGAERVTVSLGGRTYEMTKVGGVWWPARGDRFMELRENNNEWSLKTLDNLEYVFRSQAGAGRWLLAEIRDSIGGDTVKLRYNVPSEQGCTSGLALSSLSYTFDRYGQTPLYEIQLSYAPDWRPALTAAEALHNRVCATRGTEVALPFEHVRDDDRVFDRGQLLRSITVLAHNNLDPDRGAKSIRRYNFDYDHDPATGRPRLVSVKKSGEEGVTGIELPVANYHYGTLAHLIDFDTTSDQDEPELGLQFGPARMIPRYSLLPMAMRGDLSTNAVEVTENDGLRVETTRVRHMLRDFTGDGLPDLVFKDGSQWVLKENRLSDGRPSFSGATMTWSVPEELFEQTTKRRTGNSRADRAEMITTETWTQFVDWDGDGRLDILDVEGGADAKHWAVWMNRRDSNGAIQWVPAQIDITPLHSHLRFPPFSGWTFIKDGERVALDRARTWPRYERKVCKIQACTSSGCQAGVDCPNNEPGAPPTNYEYTSPVDTMTDWMLTDLNGDGYQDFVAGDVPIQQFEDGYWQGAVVVNPICEDGPADETGAYTRLCRLLHRQWIDARRWDGTLDGLEGNLEFLGSSRRVEFMNRHGAFLGVGGNQSSPFPTHGRYLSEAPYGVAYWTSSSQPSFWPEVRTGSIAGHNWQAIGYADPHGEGAPSLRTASQFDQTSGLPAFWSDQASACESGTGTYSSYQSNGELDLNGDGLLDMMARGRLRFNRGGTYGPPLVINTPSNMPFRVSETVGECSGGSRAIAGLTDLDADGRPDLLRVIDGELWMSSLTGADNADVLEAERLVAVDNGYGAKTYVKYRNAKRDEPTSHRVPFPEIVVGESGTLVDDGSAVSLAPTYYAYGRAEMVYDPLSAAWVFPGYRRQVALRGKGFRDAVEGMVTITDRDPAASAGMPYVDQVAAGRVSAVTSFEATAREPAEFLGWNGLFAHAKNTYQNRGFELANEQGTNPIVIPQALECGDLDPASGLLVGTAMCRMSGLRYVRSSESWSGDLPPPWGDNVLAGSVIEEQDRFGRPTRISGKGDLRRTDDDVCTSITYASPLGAEDSAFPSVVSSIVLTDCGWTEPDKERPGTPQILSAVHFLYDELPLGQVGRGLLTSRDVDRYGPGGFIDSHEVERITYNELGEVETTESTRNVGSSATLATQYDYDAFGATVTGIVTQASDVAIPLTVSERTSTWPSGSSRTTDQHGVTSVVEYDAHGRAMREATGAGGALHTRRMFEYDDVAPRRVIVDVFPDEAPLGRESDAEVRHRSQTVFDAVGRARYTQTELGADYGGTTIISGFTIFDELGRGRYQAAPFEAPSAFEPTPAMQLPYGTTRRFDPRGRVVREVTALGLDEISHETNVVEDTYVRSFSYRYSLGEAHVSTWGADENDPTSPRYGAHDEVWSTAIGRDVRRQRVAASGAVVDRVDDRWDRLGRVTAKQRYLLPNMGFGDVTWSSTFDSLGYRLSLTEPGTSPKTFEYDEQGNEVASGWMDGATGRNVLTRYDGFGRVTSRTLERVYGNGTTETESEDRFAWDALVDGAYQSPNQLEGRLSAIETLGVGATYFSYDDIGRRRGTTYLYAEHGTPVRENLDFGPGGLLRGVDIQTPNGQYDVRYVNDSAGRTRRVEVDGVVVFNAKLVSPKGQYKQVAYGNGVKEEFAFAPDGPEELLGWWAKTRSGSYKSSNLAFDGAGRVTMESHDTPTTGFTRSYTFDDVGQVTRSEQVGGIGEGSEEYSHDPLGNVLTRTATTGTPSKVFTFDAVDPDRLCRADDPGNGGGDCHFTYDGAGNVVHDRSASGFFSARSFKYDSANRIIGAWRDEAEVAFTYGPAGRARTRVSNADNARTVWHFGGLVEEIRPDATRVTLTQVRVPGPLGIAVSLRSDSNGGSDRVYSHGDGRGSRFFTDGTGTVVQDVAYSLFGRVLEDTGTPSSISYTDDLWNGGDYFPEVGISILGARAYDPELGRFLERDPIMNMSRAMTANPYSFAFNDPATRIDPSGLQPTRNPEELEPLTPVYPDSVVWTGGGRSGGGAGVSQPSVKGIPVSPSSPGESVDGDCPQGSGAGSYAPVQCSGPLPSGMGSGLSAGAVGRVWWNSPMGPGFHISYAKGFFNTTGAFIKDLGGKMAECGGMFVVCGVKGTLDMLEAGRRLPGQLSDAATAVREAARNPSAVLDAACPEGNCGEAGGVLGAQVFIAIATSGEGAPANLAAVFGLVDDLARGGGFEMALGLATHKQTGSAMLLRRFASRVRGKTYGEIFGSWWPGSYDLLQANISNAMNAARRLHFNLDQFDMAKYRAFAKNPVFGSGDITNWELYTIMNDSNLLKKTVFYGAGGVVVPPPTL